METSPGRPLVTGWCTHIVHAEGYLCLDAIDPRSQHDSAPLRMVLTRTGSERVGCFRRHQHRNRHHNLDISLLFVGWLSVVYAIHTRASANTQGLLRGVQDPDRSVGWQRESRPPAPFSTLGDTPGSTWSHIHSPIVTRPLSAWSTPVCLGHHIKQKHAPLTPHSSPIMYYRSTGCYNPSHFSPFEHLSLSFVS